MKIIIYAALLLLLTSCVATTAKLAPVAGDYVAEAPQMQIGDRWKINDQRRNQVIEKEVVDVKADGGFTMRLSTDRRKFATAEYNKDNQLLEITGSKPEGRDWDNTSLIDYPLFVGKTYQINRPAMSLMRGNILDFTWDCKVVDLTQQEVLTKTVHIFTISFTISHSEGWSDYGKVLYSPELKSIVKIVPGWGADTNITAYQVLTDQLQHISHDGTRQLDTGSAERLVFGYNDSNIDSTAIARERETLAKDRARIEKDRLEIKELARLAATLRSASAAAEKESERLAAKTLAEAQLKTELLRAELLAEQKRTTELEAAKQAAAEIQTAKDRAAQKMIEENKRYGIAVIIGNKNYSPHNADVPDVSYAHNDADAIYRHVKETLGFLDGNIIQVKDATQAELASIFGNDRSHKGKLFNWTKAEKSKIFIYYSGHGAPGLSDGNGYLLPVNANPMTVELNGYPLETLYANLAKIPARQITVVLDACFSGSSASGNLVKSASSIALRRVESKNVLKNAAVLTASAVSEVASWDNDRKLGLFTANFLDGVNGGADQDEFGNGDGRVVLSELKEYLETKVSYAARRNYYRDQHPSITGDERLVLSNLQ